MTMGSNCGADGSKELEQKPEVLRYIEYFYLQFLRKAYFKLQRAR